MSRPYPQPFNLPAGLSVGATLAFARAAYELRGPDAEVSLPVVGLLVDVSALEVEARAAGALDAQTLWTRHTGTPAEFLDTVNKTCAPDLFLAALRLVLRFATPREQLRPLLEVCINREMAARGGLYGETSAHPLRDKRLDEHEATRPTFIGEDVI